MPYVNLKLVKEQVTPDQKQQIVDGLVDIIVNIMNRNKDLTVITIDEIDGNNWIIGGQPISTKKDKYGKVSYVNIKISKGTSSAQEMEAVLKAGKYLMSRILGNSDKTNYFIIEELNPDGWGFDGLTMTARKSVEERERLESLIK